MSPVKRSTSFDDIDDDDEPVVVEGVMDTVDNELRNMVAMMPGRNEERMFSDAAIGSTHRRSASGKLPRAVSSAPPTSTGYGDTGSYYYYTYSEGAGANTRADMESAPSRSGRESIESDIPPVPNFDLGNDKALGFTLAGWGQTGESFAARQNIADALTTVCNRFWSEDLEKIVAILRRRFRQLMPHARRIMSHIVAFWGGITYIRRALGAFIRILKKDSRVKELLERTAWASASTLRVFLSMCVLCFRTMIRFYSIMRHKIIPELRHMLPRYYNRTVESVLQLAARSPWALMLGPASFQLALHREKLPDPLWLHRKFGIAVDETTKSHAARDTVRSRTPTSVNYTYTYGTVTTERNIDDNGDGGGSRPVSDGDGSSYYYTYGTGYGDTLATAHNAQSSGGRVYEPMRTLNGRQHQIASSGAYAKSRPLSKSAAGKENMHVTRPVSRTLEYASDDDPDADMFGE